MIDLVIRISEELYDEILNEIEHAEIAGVGLGDFSIALKNGILLPKGHGDLVDRKEMLDEPYKNGGFVEWYNVIKYAQTIIEADKEAADERHS